MPDLHSGIEAATNPLDVLLHAQRHINAIDDPREQDEEMRKYFEIINAMFEQEVAALHDVTIGSDIALLGLTTVQDAETTRTDSGLLLLNGESPEEEIQTRLAIVERVGIVGDVQGLSYLQLGKRATGYALSVGAYHLFKMDEPDVNDIMIRPAHIPIQAVNYIEYSDPLN